MRSWIALVAAATSACALVALLQRRANADLVDAVAVRPSSSSSASVTPPSVPPPKTAALPPLAALNLAKLVVHDDEVIAPAASGRVAHLTVDPSLQRTAQQTMRQYGFPEAAIVMTDTATGRVLTWASYVDKGPHRDLCTEASAPAASLFKIVTASALVEKAGLTPETRQCYSGGESKLVAADLVDDPKRDRWCATLSEAMGRSLNAVFGKLAVKKLTQPELLASASAFGFGEPLPFDVPVEISAVRLPEDKLGFGRTAAGFWNTTLSPLAAANLAGTVANRGEMLRPYIVDRVTDGATTLYQAPKKQLIRRSIQPDTATALTVMMESTVMGGTSYRAFHDGEGRAFLPHISVAGKTGTLTRAETAQFYTWFVGFHRGHGGEYPHVESEGEPRGARTPACLLRSQWRGRGDSTWPALTRPNVGERSRRRMLKRSPDR